MRSTVELRLTCQGEVQGFSTSQPTPPPSYESAIRDKRGFSFSNIIPHKHQLFSDKSDGIHLHETETIVMTHCTVLCKVFKSSNNFMVVRDYHFLKQSNCIYPQQRKKLQIIFRRAYFISKCVFGTNLPKSLRVLTRY